LSNKVYVDVLAEFSKDGLLIPKEITWEDGRKYEITRVKDKRRAASTRAGGVGERYTCVVDGKEIFLFYEDNNMWFMERAGAWNSRQQACKGDFPFLYEYRIVD